MATRTPYLLSVARLFLFSFARVFPLAERGIEFSAGCKGKSAGSGGCGETPRRAGSFAVWAREEIGGSPALARAEGRI